MDKSTLEAASAARAVSVLSESRNRFDTSPNVPDGVTFFLNDMFRVLQGISTITKILAESSVLEDFDDGTPLGSTDAYGLMVGAQALSDLLMQRADDLADSQVFAGACDISEVSPGAGGQVGTKRQRPHLA
ncbi:hypothetical protein [Burkholderia cepacia]|uniref:hypothetical protein n=1 Tax=Burkholderia cepacia TaxID=292 RepID=UPI002ABD943A|nr:hypothetical protein [Burkholderia cepacia]